MGIKKHHLLAWGILLIDLQGVNMIPHSSVLKLISLVT